MSNEMHSNKIKIRIVIIDSGFSPHPGIRSAPRDLMTLTVSEEGNVDVFQGASDTLGHGTAVYSIISSELSEIADIIVLKAFYDTMYTDENYLISALQFCIDNLSPDIVHMSNGITCCANLQLLKQVCAQAFQRNIYIVAAFDNFGAITYPASLKETIGVDVSNDIRSGFIYSGRDDVNLILPNLSIRVPWLNGTYFTCNGTSFNACYATIMICKKMYAGALSRKELMDYFKANATMVIEQVDSLPAEKCPNIEKAIVLPFNKEIRTLMRYVDMLPFNIMGVYDIKYCGVIGANVWNTLFMQSPNGYEALTIESIDTINWHENFDAVIVGHISEIDKITQKNYAKDIVNKCLAHGKTLISLGDLKIDINAHNLFRKNGRLVYFPHVSKDDIPHLYNGKMRKIGIPTLGIFGTSSKQGKFSLQLELRRYFQDRCYNVGQLGSEPTSALFGFDEVFPMGYESTVETTGDDNIAIINEMMGRIEDKNPDLIIVGAQSQTIPQYRGNLSLYVLRQHEFILATEPDAILLCVNIFDDDRYIRNTIKYIESIIDSDGIGLVLFPLKREFRNGILTDKLIMMSESELLKGKSRLHTQHGRPVFIAGEDIDAIGELCIRYFTE